MRAFLIVEREVTVKPGGQGRHGRVLLDIEVFILDRPPEPLDENVIQCTSSTIHADTYSGLFQAAGKGCCGELNTLVCVEDRWLSPAQSLLQRVETEATIQCVGELPGQNIAAVPVNDGNEIHEAFGHGHIGDIGAPDLIGTSNGQIAQQIWIDLVLR